MLPESCLLTAVTLINVILRPPSTKQLSTPLHLELKAAQASLRVVLRDLLQLMYAHAVIHIHSHDFRLSRGPTGESISFCFCTRYAVMHTLMARPGLQGLQVRAAFVLAFMSSCTRVWRIVQVADYSILLRLLTHMHVHRHTELVCMGTPANLPPSLRPNQPTARNLPAPPGTDGPPRPTTATDPPGNRPGTPTKLSLPPTHPNFWQSSWPWETFISKPRPAGLQIRQPKCVWVSAFQTYKIPAARNLRIWVLSQNQISIARSWF